jgi:hypothetical protein
MSVEIREIDVQHQTFCHILSWPQTKDLLLGLSRSAMGLMTHRGAVVSVVAAQPSVVVLFAIHFDFGYEAGAGADQGGCEGYGGSHWPRLLQQLVP